MKRQERAMQKSIEYGSMQEWHEFVCISSLNVISILDGYDVIENYYLH